MAFSSLLSNMKRVWKVTKKPSKKEYFLTVKIVLIGFLIVGLVGFLMEMLWQALFKRFFGL